MPFDNAAHRTIFVDLADWHSTEDGRSRLAAFARAIKEPGYKVSNPITQANASFKMRQSADPLERMIAQLQERINTLELRSTQPNLTGIGKMIGEGLDQRNTPDHVVEEMNIGQVLRKCYAAIQTHSLALQNSVYSPRTVNLYYFARTVSQVGETLPRPADDARQRCRGSRPAYSLVQSMWLQA